MRSRGLVRALWVFGATVFAFAFVVNGAARLRDEPPGSVVFESDRTGDWNVYVANANGTELRALTTSGGQWPAPSPDGSKVAFVRYEPTPGGGSEASIFVFDTLSGAEDRVARGDEPAWSPDGRRLAYTYRFEIHAVDVDGTQDRRLTSAARDDIASWSAHPAWSPDNRTIAFEKLGGLFVVSPDGTGMKQLYDRGTEPRGLAKPVWSPDSSKIAFVGSTCCADKYSYRTVESTLYSLSLATGTVVALSEGVDEAPPAWSPDGSELAFGRNEAEDTVEIYLAAIEDGMLRRLTRNVAGESSWLPAWSSDGQWIAYLRGRFPGRFYSSSYDVFVTRKDGSSPQPVTRPFPTGGSHYSPSWVTGTRPPSPQPAPQLVAVPATLRFLAGLIGAVDAQSSRVLVLASTSASPLLWDPARPGFARVSACGDDGEGDVSAIELVRDAAASVCEFRHGVVDPVTDVNVVITDLARRRTESVFSAELEGHYPDAADLPVIDGEGSLLVFSERAAGGKLFRIDLGPGKAKARRIATGLALADVGANAIAAWRGDNRLVVLRPDGRVVHALRLDRTRTTSVKLAGAALFVTTNDRLVQYDTNGHLRRAWRIADEGGRPATIVAVERGVAVYVSGSALHLLRLSSGRDVVLQLPRQGPDVDAALTTSGLFYAYNQVWTSRPGRLGYVPLSKVLARIP